LILLDTHVLVRWVTGQNKLLSTPARRAIEQELADGEILVSAISAWEIALLVSHGRLDLSIDVADWLAIVAEFDALRFVPVDNEIALKSTQLPGELHRDPADRMILATSRLFAAPLVTADKQLLAYPYARTIW
jgi:PIN domain nuclease of toxin-antitoxin system